MDCNTVKPNMKVATVRLRETTGIIVGDRHLEVRKAGVAGTVLGQVPGHGGEVWFVKHDNSQEVGAYCYDELEPA